MAMQERAAELKSPVSRPSSTHVLCKIVRFITLDVAHRRRKTKNSTYLVSLDQRGLVRSAPGYCGKLRSNFLGTAFTAFDTDGSKPLYPVRGGLQFTKLLYTCAQMHPAWPPQMLRMHMESTPLHCDIPSLWQTSPQSAF